MLCKPLSRYVLWAVTMLPLFLLLQPWRAHYRHIAMYQMVNHPLWPGCRGRDWYLIRVLIHAIINPSLLNTYENTHQTPPNNSQSTLQDDQGYPVVFEVWSSMMGILKCGPGVPLVVFQCCFEEFCGVPKVDLGHTPVTILGTLGVTTHPPLVQPATRSVTRHQ
jgi:hypothetical protein